MTGPAIAWVVILASGFGAAWLVFFALRRRAWSRWIAASLVLAWTATPFRLDEGHIAPALVVFFFRRFLEDGANPRPPLSMLVLVTVLVLALGCAAAGLAAWRRRRRG